MAAASGRRVRGRRGKLREGLVDDLKAFAEHQFALGRRDEHGASERDHLEGLLARARTDERRAEIEAQIAGPPIPWAMEPLWATFLRISNRRGSTGFGPAAITWPDLDAFVRLSGVLLSPWEIEVIEGLDTVYLTALAQKAEEKGS